mmetsp:Transcript_55308/g.103738  ORF Transcript_55308/g.103738 Transcript_55308/m.103738 type:complete len:260 (+) Transcript_55308:769-1548(+)
MQIDPILQSQEIQLSGVSVLFFALRSLLYQHSWKLLYLETLHNVRLILCDESKLDGALEDRLRRKRLPHQGNGLLVGEEQRLGLRYIRSQKLVHVVLVKPLCLIRHELGELVEDCLSLQFALQFEGRHRVWRINHDSGRFLDSLLLAKNRILFAVDGTDLGHALHVSGNLVVLIQKLPIFLAVIFEKPKTGYGTISELRNDAVKRRRLDLHDVMLHCLNHHFANCQAWRQCRQQPTTHCARLGETIRSLLNEKPYDPVT